VSDGGQAAGRFAGKRDLTGWDLFRLTPPNGPIVPVVQTQFDEHDADVAPDGRWIAFVTNETGRDEVRIVRPDGNGARVLSANGGSEPSWSRDGRELFYREGDRMIVVPLERSTGLLSGTPKVLFDGRYLPCEWPGGPRNYDAARDGSKFVMVARKLDVRPRTIHVIVNWPALISAAR
jgi:dipeptidyl aminopeptidase/acylaminoacyl peptidase